jgi:hypothetical protein
MKSKRDFKLNFIGDKSEIMRVINQFNWLDESHHVRDIYRQQVLDSAQCVDDDELYSFSWRVDSLFVMAALIEKMRGVADQVDLWAYGYNDEAGFEIGLMQRGHYADIDLITCKSRLKDSAGEVAQVAQECYQRLHDVLKSDWTGCNHE